MSEIMRRASLMSAALLALVLVLGVTGAVMGPAPAAHALSGYRVFGVFNSSTRGDLYGTGLVAMIYKDDHNNETCSKKIDFMRDHYGSAYAGSSARRTFIMVDCETFGARIGEDDEVDICRDMDVNLIYRYTSKYDARYPGGAAGISFWHR
ncbi:hypothetical protein [Clavibacter capsici]|uniref:hypothetical protein n=1 Tax=Clavibacter capsici TaxID=1874630 RepID=UPI001427FC70|nr:hypothetical protein [Clavibacter capsici]QIS39728.1 hypothetical protein GW572_11475 [Clavibacter capsici]